MLSTTKFNYFESQGREFEKAGNRFMEFLNDMGDNETAALLMIYGYRIECGGFIGRKGVEDMYKKFFSARDRIRRLKDLFGKAKQMRATLDMNLQKNCSSYLDVVGSIKAVFLFFDCVTLTDSMEEQKEYFEAETSKLYETIDKKLTALNGLRHET